MAVSETMGFANLPNQVHRKSVKKGFEFTLMVVGETGLGKSTLVNSLFRTELYANRKSPSIKDVLAKSTVDIASQTVDIEERGVKLRLTVVDTPGFGEGLNSSDCIEPIVDYVDKQFEKYFLHENGLNRRQIADSRIHCCFYFVSPVGYSLKPIDVAFMKALHKKVNIIPLIAKADMLTKKEVGEMKKRILKDIMANEITIYSVPDCEADEDDTQYKEQIEQLKAAMPFAISASLEKHEVRGKSVQGRAYPWGVVETENPEHSDFVKLRSLLVTNMQDLREVTHELHYENFRSHRIVHNTGTSNYSFEASTIEGIDDDDSKRKLQEKEAEIEQMKMMMIQMQQQLQNKTPANGHSNGHTESGDTPDTV
ncbi:Septin-2 [Halotydeus destructor]|nr:Septin-2 [Halotydeus destructor]